MKRRRVVARAGILLVAIFIAVPGQLRAQEVGSEPEVAPTDQEPSVEPSNQSPKAGGNSASFYATFPAPSVLYSVDGSNDSAIGIIEETGGHQPDITDLALAPDGTLYGVEFNRLYTIDPSTAIATPVGLSLGLVGNFNALTFSKGGVLFGATQEGDLATIDTATGDASVVGNMGSGVGSTGDLVFDDGGTLYGTVTGFGAVNDVLVTIDPGSGVATPVNSTDPDSGGSDLFGLTYEADRIRGFLFYDSSCSGGAIADVRRDNGNVDFATVTCLGGQPGGAASPPAAAPGGNAQYVALGDSFSSGEGAQDYQKHTATDDFDGFAHVNECHRSLVAFPELIVKRAESIGTLSFWACSGARIPDLRTKITSIHRTPWDDPIRESSQPTSQLGRLDDSTDLVTITISGNDAAFGPVITSCVVPRLFDCRSHWTVNGVDLVQDQISRLHDPLRRTFEDVKLAAPNASVWVLAYPHIFKPDALFHPPGCAGLRAGEIEWLVHLTDELNQVIRSAAKQVGVRFVHETSTAFGDDHLLCSRVPYVNGAIPILTMNPEEAFHPNAAGHNRLADILVDDLDVGSLPANPDPVADEPAPDPPSGDIHLATLDVVEATGPTGAGFVIPGKSGIHIRSSGLEPNAGYTGVIQSDPVSIGSYTSDGDGVLDIDVVAPESLEAGHHVLRLEGPSPAGGTLWAVESLISTLAFNDIGVSTFETDIYWLGATGVTRGCNPPTNDRYCPDDPVTRGQMAAFLVRALGYTDNGGGDLFVDDNGHTFENDIDKLGTAEVTKGCNPPTNDQFCPDDLVTRGQMAAFLVRALSYSDNGGGDLFVDDNGHTFENDIDKLGTARVTKGCNPPTNDRFCPEDLVTRGQMAAFLHRALTSR